ncbi:MAG: tRNA (adenosine(37)-N6)-dimethylallyltransferase MiaA [Candidatus Kapaibacteriales bacterium]
MDNEVVDKLIQNKIALAVVGPTASGKTKFALKIAREIPLEIISADSRQIYRYLDIGTAKPTSEELTTATHYFIDIRNPDEYYSAGEFGKEAEAKVFEIFDKGKLPLIVGGSGLYIKSLTEGFFEENFSSEEKSKAFQIRKELNLYSKDALYSRLLEVDPETARLYPDKNYVRLIRSLEFYYVKGIPISLYRKLYHRNPKFKTIYIGISLPRDKLYSNIEQRVDWMIQNGLISEVQNILDLGFSPELNSLKTLGYKEIIDYLDKRITLSEAIALIKQNTRRYAKRQITWFKKNLRIVWFDSTYSSIEKNVLDFLNKFVF